MVLALPKNGFGKKQMVLAVPKNHLVVLAVHAGAQHGCVLTLRPFQQHLQHAHVAMERR